MIRSATIFLSVFACAGSAQAEVKASSANGFSIENKVIVSAEPTAVFSALGRVSAWWNKDHTYSGDASRLILGLNAGECFCERLADGGSVEHMRVVQARPGQMLRLQGGLGPLQGEAAVGTLTFMLKPLQYGTEITQSYIVGGHIAAGPERLAPAVDQVLAEQLKGLAAHLHDQGGKRSD